MKPKSRTILLNNQKIILQEEFGKRILEDISWSMERLFTHHDICLQLKDKSPFTVTVLIELLKSEYRNRKEFVKKTNYPKRSLYRERLYEEFFKDFGNKLMQRDEVDWNDQQANEIYLGWFEKYRPLWEKERPKKDVDEYIVERELEPRYKDKILKRFKNHKNLFKPRFTIDRERYYNLPEPLNDVDWRNPYDNIFVWEENGKKVASRGGSGSSGGRERNSTFIYGLLELNKIKPVPSYLFIYSEENTLLFVTKFNSFCVPHSDIGANYQIDPPEDDKLKQGGLFLDWDDYSKVRSITATSYDQSIKTSLKRFETEFKNFQKKYQSVREDDSK